MNIRHQSLVYLALWKRYKMMLVGKILLKIFILQQFVQDLLQLHLLINARKIIKISLPV